MNAPLSNRDESLDLLIKHSSEGLSPAEQQQLQALLADDEQAATDQLQQDCFAESMSALQLLAELDSTTSSPAMPSALAARILAAAPVTAQQLNTSPLADHKIVPLRTSATITHVSNASSQRFATTGWWVAAACFALAVWGWWPRLLMQSTIAPSTVTLTAAAQRAQLLNSGRAIQASWQPGNDPAATALQGDVVFDPVSQRGYLRFRGIPANDPRLAQYQLWIADGARRQPQPVDGGVFDVATNPNAPQTTPEGDVIIPFEAKLQVGKAAAFVVTVEQPGGVVVSSQERVLALAAVTQ